MQFFTLRYMTAVTMFGAVAAALHSIVVAVIEIVVPLTHR